MENIKVSEISLAQKKIPLLCGEYKRVNFIQGESRMVVFRGQEKKGEPGIGIDWSMSTKLVLIREKIQLCYCTTMGYIFQKN